MMMKKFFWIFVFAVSALSSCREMDPAGEEGGPHYKMSSLHFDLSIENSATKAVRTGWQNGDKVFIFFAGVNGAYVTVTHDGAQWGEPVLVGDAALEATGKMTAVYLPYVNSLAPEFSGDSWAFPGTQDYYFLRAENVTYYITDSSEPVATLGAHIYMEAPSDYIQFYLPDETPVEEVRLASNNMIPAGLSSIGLDASVRENEGELGGWVTGYSDTIEGERGFYFSGRLNPRPSTYCYFALMSTPSGGNTAYRNFGKQRRVALAERGAYQLPAADSWPEVSASEYAIVGGNTWCTVNAGATHPWELGTAYGASGMSGALAADTFIPSDVEWTLLLDRRRATWLQMSIGEVGGYLVVDKEDPSQYFFLPFEQPSGSAYWSGSVSEGVQHYFEADSYGNHGVKALTPPETAYVRLVSSVRRGGFRPPVDGGDI